VVCQQRIPLCTLPVDDPSLYDFPSFLGHFPPLFLAFRSARSTFTWPPFHFFSEVESIISPFLITVLPLDLPPSLSFFTSTLILCRLCPSSSLAPCVFEKSFLTYSVLEQVLCFSLSPLRTYPFLLGEVLLFYFHLSWRSSKAGDGVLFLLFDGISRPGLPFEDYALLTSQPLFSLGEG